MLQNVWLLLGLLGFLGYVPLFPAEMRLLNLFFLVPVMLSIVRSYRNRKDMQAAEPKEPIPPSAGGRIAFLLRLFASTVLCCVVPTMLWQIIRHWLGQIWAERRGVTNPKTYQQKVQYRLPFDGVWYIINGGVSKATSHSWEVVGQRYAYDFVIADEAKRRWRTDGKALDDYLCYGMPILAPADGEIVAVVDGVRDAPGVGTGWIDIFTRHFPGNSVTIRHAENEYSFLAHLVPGSVCVKVGDKIKQGMMIGLCGNSGHSTEPHLHFHLQDHKDFFRAAGLPIKFSDVVVNGKPEQEPTYIVRGTHVSRSDNNRTLTTDLPQSGNT
jgi:murein DD-endopeptidase MepM/ murein hydrolase activator NlpD